MTVAPGAARAPSKSLVLTAMIFAVAMTFIDQTIVSIAATTVQHDLGLSSSGIQWAINAYLLSMAALFAFGGRLGDTLGHTKMVVLGVIIFAVASAMCGLTPHGGGAEAWLITFRAIQGAGGALMFPAALAIVVATFDFGTRGRALALFFGIAGGLTAVGPIAGGYLIEWTWRSIFWINVPVAVIALVLIYLAKPVTEYKHAPIDYRGLALIIGGVGLSVFGFQQSQLWGWGNGVVIGAIVVGILLLVVFALVELRTAQPLMNMHIFRIKPFLVENIILTISMMAFIPVFFFASTYGQISLALKPTDSSLLILYFFIGFVIFAQVGGRMLDRDRGQAAGGRRQRARRGRLLPVGGQGDLAAAGLADDLHHHGRGGHGAHAGAGQHRRDQPGLTAVLRRGHRHHPDRPQLRRQPRFRHPRHGAAVGVPLQHLQLADRPARARGGGGQGGRLGRSASGRRRRQQRGNGVASIPQFIRADFATATQSVLTGMGVIMAVCAVVAFIGLRAGRQQAMPDADPAAAGASVPGQREPGRTGTPVAGPPDGPVGGSAGSTVDELRD